MIEKNANPRTLADQVYLDLRRALTEGRFAPGQSLTIRGVATAVGASATPVREALRRLVSDTALILKENGRIYVPVMTRKRMLEIREARLALEAIVVDRAVNNIDRAGLSNLRIISLNILAARERGSIKDDLEGIRNFHFEVYRIADAPTVTRLLETLWISTGPYLNLLFPNFISRRTGAERAALIDALKRRDSAEARRIIEDDVGGALGWIASQAGQNDLIPASIRTRSPRNPLILPGEHKRIGHSQGRER